MAGKLKRSPLAPRGFPKLPSIPGVRLGGAACGIRYRGRNDLMLATLAPGSAVAGVFTRSSLASAPVEWCRKRIGGGRARAIVVNAGNANVHTGRAGEKAVARTAGVLARLLDCPEKEIFVASTGVIGEPLAVERIETALPALAGKLKSCRWREAADAILTTDTYPKGACAVARIGGTPVTIGGFAKGSGMIAPDMATMLAFLFTDAKIPPAVLKKLLAEASERSFNSITVDSDTSTSDSVFLCATGKGKAHKAVRSAADPLLRGFRKALQAVTIDLAQQIVRDGEGASKFLTITVTGAASEKAARRIGLAIANSPLVKTAIAGEDPNWGRVVMAVGKSDERVAPKKLAIRIGGLPVAKGGERVPGYKEAPVARHMKGSAIDLAVDVGVGRGKATVWTCDLTHGYIDINADYRS
ncbi:MAG: bifunctional glutamate N-acetyltransferase/amino-acid acetyltransferase ArgJ [Alphaproteobacteria bacterium]|nr:bifunctional glutamate N-acetyltransferase/amino-acid acetyltransferase ArgJ [Alphaproteobacteria bacterium]